MTKTLEEPVASDAASFDVIRTERPNRFVVLFASDRTLQRDSCAKNEELIVANLEKRLNSSVSLTLVIDPSISNPSSAKSSFRFPRRDNPEGNVQSFRQTPQNNVSPVAQNAFSEKRNYGGAGQTQRVNAQNLRRQFEQNEVVQEIKEVFEAELGEIKKSASNAQNIGYPRERYEN